MIHALIGLVALTAMEIVLGIDNIVFITIAVEELPEENRPRARFIGLGLALLIRIVLLAFASYIVQMEASLVDLTKLGLREDWLQDIFGMSKEGAERITRISGRDLVLLAGGLFLIKSAVREIHVNVEGEHEEETSPKKSSFAGVITQIVLLDVIFSLDSVITAVGMSRNLYVMIGAVIIAMGVMLLASKAVGDFVGKHPTVKMLALSFLLLIGVMLFAEGIGTEIEKGYIYFAMAFALVVEMLNLRMRSKRAKKEHNELPLGAA